MAFNTNQWHRQTDRHTHRQTDICEHKPVRETRQRDRQTHTHKQTDTWPNALLSTFVGGNNTDQPATDVCCCWCGSWGVCAFDVVLTSAGLPSTTCCLSPVFTLLSSFTDDSATTRSHSVQLHKHSALNQCILPTQQPTSVLQHWNSFFMISVSTNPAKQISSRLPEDILRKFQ